MDPPGNTSALLGVHPLGQLDPWRVGRHPCLLSESEEGDLAELERELCGAFVVPGGRGEG